ncbi:Ribokinase-like protein [Peziza echinospora]|nr:Ribokinase-like protein [Peziza echinospora]
MRITPPVTPAAEKTSVNELITQAGGSHGLQRPSSITSLAPDRNHGAHVYIAAAGPTDRVQPAPCHQTDFATLGMFIIDTIHHPNGQTLNDVPGGAGLFAHLGARLLSPPPHSQYLQLILHLGRDFPPALLEELNSLKTNICLIDTPWRKTTRGENTYDKMNPGKRGFKYLTEKKRVVMDDILERSNGNVGAVHMICANAEKVDIYSGRGTVIWEPVPDSIVPECLEETLVSLEELGIQIFSPNEEELERYFETPTITVTSPQPPHNHQQHSTDKLGHPSSTQEAQKHTIENSVTRFLSSSPVPLTKTTIVIRAGQLGCYIYPPPHLGRPTWLPPYHTSASAIVDATGAGNAFLGGLAIGLLRQPEDVVLACAYANVAAGFIVEQVGMPVFEYANDGTGREWWNGEGVEGRLRGYVRRVREESVRGGGGGKGAGLEGLGVGRKDEVLGVDDF